MLKCAIQIYCKPDTGYSSHIDVDYSVVRTPQRMEQYFFTERKNSCGESIIEYHSDIWLMFHAEKLDTSTKQALIEKLKSQPPTDPVRQLADKLSDDQLLQFVKSRYCQSLSEVRQYASAISRMYNGEFQRYVDSLKPAEPAPAPGSDSGSE